MANPTETSRRRVDRKTLTEQVFEQVLSMLLSGELSSGEPLRESELAVRLGVSRTPIREALGRLAEYGVVETRPNHGAVVRRLGGEELAHIHEVREALEGMAAERACGRLDADDFACLDALAASRSSQRRELDLIARADRRHLEARPGDAALEARIRSFETAFGMQSEAPHAFDLSEESDATLALYGLARPDDRV